MNLQQNTNGAYERIMDSKNRKRNNAKKNRKKQNESMVRIKAPQIIIFFAAAIILIIVTIISWPTEDGTKRIGNSEIVYDSGKVKLVKNVNNERIIVERLRKEGYSDYAIAGILARWRKESGIDPSIIEGQFAKSKVSRLIMARRMFIDEKYRENVYFNYSSTISLYEEAFFGSESHTDKTGYLYHMLGLGLGQWTGRRAIAFLCYLGEDEWSENPKYKGWNSIQRQLDYFCFDMDYEIAYGKSESYRRMLENNDISPYSVRFYPSYYQYICNAIHQDFRTLAPSSELSEDEVFQKTIDAMNTYEGGSAGVTIDDVREMYERISREWSDGK